MALTLGLKDTAAVAEGLSVTVREACALADTLDEGVEEGDEGLVFVAVALQKAVGVASDEAEGELVDEESEEGELDGAAEEVEDRTGVVEGKGEEEKDAIFEVEPLRAADVVPEVEGDWLALEVMLAYEVPLTVPDGIADALALKELLGEADTLVV